MIQRVGVVGAGTMGIGLAHLCAAHGFSVKVHDSVPAALERLPARLKEGLDSSVLKGKLSAAEAERAFHGVEPAASLAGLADADLVIEAVSEDLQLKRDVFAALGRACPDAILATNTSSLLVGKIAEPADFPERVLGMHFFNPPFAMRLVEMVRSAKTSPDVFKAAWEFTVLGLKRTPVEAKDTPGFIVNRVMRPYYLQAQTAALNGCGIMALDQAARSTGVPLGPFELMDLIGVDVNLAITKAIYEALGRPDRLAPIPLQESLVKTGQLGRKTGRGFYNYRDGKQFGENPELSSLLPRNKELSPADAWRWVLGAVVAEAQRVFAEGVASKSDIDTAIKLAMNFPKGPFEWQKIIEGTAA